MMTPILDAAAAAKIVNACVCLHNIANVHNLPIPDDDNEESDDDRQPQQTVATVTSQTADLTRAMLVQKLWDARPRR